MPAVRGARPIKNKELSDFHFNIDKNQIKDNDWNCYKEFNPENVMNIFNNIFVN